MALVLVIGSVAPTLADARQGAVGGPSLQAMAPPPLARGVCAVFLWSRQAGARDQALLGAVAIAPPTARIQPANGPAVSLPRVAESGERAPGYYERQVFRGAGVTLEVRLRFAREPSGPPTPQTGLAIVTDARGWRSVTPVRGDLVCQDG